MMSVWRNFTVVLLVFVGVAGCSQAEERYSVPERVCGVPMSEGVVRSVLPDGAKLEEYGDPLPKKHAFCGLAVDDVPAISMSFGTATKFFDPLLEFADQFRDGEEIALDLPGSGALDDDNAAIILQCGLPERPHIIANIRIPPQGGVSADLSRAEMERFAVDYMTGAAQELGCPEAKASAGSE